MPNLQRAEFENTTLHSLTVGEPPSTSLHSETAIKLAGAFSSFSINIVEVESSLESVSAEYENLTEAFHQLSDLSKNSLQQSNDVRDIVNRSNDAITRSTFSLRTCSSAMTETSSEIAKLNDTIQSMSTQIQNLQQALGNVAAVSNSIEQIARQTNLLALNATIEASRAGEAGRGFAVVAAEVKALSGQTSSATAQIQQTLAKLTEESEALIAQGMSSIQGVSNVHASTMTLESSICDVGNTLEEVAAFNQTIDAGMDDIDVANRQIAGTISSVDALVKRNSDALQTASAQLANTQEKADELVSFTIESDIDTDDTKFFKLALNQAEAIQKAFQAALDAGQTNITDLFDDNYQPIQNTDPAQVTTRFTELTDRLLPAIQEPVLSVDSRITFCAAVDRNGYLPTHNKKFSHPPSADPVWNAANCRNRRIFNDKVGLSAGRNTSPFLLQTYRRDMGGGNFVIMKDLSVPIFINGRHWGGLRLAYKV